ncbi:MAG: hypothetical protein P8Z79_03510 [Sedimentisphaerales bacterium]
MGRLTRQVALVVALTCFGTMVTGALLYLHLLSHERPGEHDPEHCSICQQLVISRGKFTTEPPVNLPSYVLHAEHAEFQPEFCIAAFDCEPFGPRPPPAA